jgi:hypothetical protein
MAVENKLNDTIQNEINKMYDGLDHEDNNEDVIDHDHLTKDESDHDIDSIVDSVDSAMSKGASKRDVDRQSGLSDDSNVSSSAEEDNTSEANVTPDIDADSDIMKFIDAMTQDDANKTKDTLHKEGYDDKSSSYSQGMMTFIFTIMGIGLVFTVISLLSSLAWPIPFIGSWNLVIGVFMMLYGSLFLLNWRR